MRHGLPGEEEPPASPPNPEGPALLSLLSLPPPSHALLLLLLLLSSTNNRCLLPQYQPRKGDALLFWSMHPNGTMDKHSLHGGCPVKKGEKWVMTKWIRVRLRGRAKGGSWTLVAAAAAE